MKVPDYVGCIKLGNKVVGTGFLVREDGIIATCNHVIESARTISTSNQLTFQLFVNNETYTATLKDYDGKYDIALLTLDRPVNSIAVLISSQRIQPSMKFSTIGYGLLEDQGHTYKYLPADGDLTGPGERDGIELIQISSKDLLRGMSGSPLIVQYDGRDCVVGMISERYSITESKDRWREHTGWAIGSEHIERLLSGRPLDFERQGEGVFLSYSSEDMLFVKQLYDDLKIRGIKSLWMDREKLLPGDDWNQRIRHAILKESSHVIVCISTASLSSAPVQYEYELALGATPPKHVFPLIIDKDCTFEMLPPPLNKLQARSIPADGYDKTLSQLIQDGELPKLHHILPEFMRVPGGMFTMGGEGEEQDLEITEFWLGKTSVTVREFICFVVAGGYDSDKYWLPGTFEKWRSGPLYRNWPDYDLKSYALSNPLQPMRGITWFEAMAYCKWLSYVSIHQFTLPAEAQWEKAARGTDARLWAFGNEWKADAADVRSHDDAPRKTPKNCGIPGSESFYECQDMIGHIWNWTLSIESTRPYVNDGKSESIEPDNLDEPRVIRGGSWRQPADKAYAYQWESLMPISSYYTDEIGFRIATNVDPTGLSKRYLRA